MSDNQDAIFIENIVKQLVEKPEDVKVERTVDEMGVLIQLTVDQTDMGRVIGKEGRTAKALRTLLRVLGAKNNARVNLKIMEPDGGEVRIAEDGGSNNEGPMATNEVTTSTDTHDDQPAMAEVTESPIAETPANDDQITEVL